MFANQRRLAKVLFLTTCLASPASLMAGGYGESGVRDAGVANAGRAEATVPCPKLNRNIPVSLAAEMDCGTATPRVAGERVRNTGGGLFGGHRIGSAPPANTDNDTPFTNVRTPGPSGGGDGPTFGDDGPTDDGPADDVDIPVDGDDGPTDGGDGPTDGGDGPTDGGTFTSKTDRFNELGISFDSFADQSDAFKDSFDSYVEQNGPNGDWSGFNPPQ